jgi:hypothetical protein
MSLPLSIQNIFNDTYNGVPAVKLRSSSETKNLEATLRVHQQSYQTKISKTKKSGREFVVMLLEPTKEVSSGA